MLAAILLLAAAESTCVPINCDMFWVTFPDGKADAFVRTEKDANLLAGTYPWFGVVRPERRMVNIATQASYKGPARQYGYVDGHLRFAEEKGQERTVEPVVRHGRAGDIRAFWPTEETYEEQRRSVDYWRGAGRLRWFSGNPNRTALIFVEFGLIVLCIGLFAGNWIFRIGGLGLFLAASCLTFLTESRGGFLALVTGGVILGFFRFRRGITRRMILGALAVCLLGGVGVVVSKCGERFTTGIVKTEKDKSSQDRLFIWREVPRMISAAPWGWGLWKSGPAYNDWFEDFERRHMIGDLFNDHLSRFVEGGFVMGGLYVLVWALLFVWGLRLAWSGGSPLPLAVCAAYFVASTFNPMNWWTKGFYLPVAVLAWGMWKSWTGRSMTSGKESASPLMRLLVWAGGVTAVVLAGVGVIAWTAPGQDVPLRVGWMGHRVIVGRGEPKVWVADDGFVLNGNFNGYPGREFRKFYSRRPDAEAVGLVERVCDLPPEMERLVLTGTCGEDYLKMDNPPKARHLVFLTPPFGSDRIPQELRETCDVHLLTGEFAAQRTGDDLRKADWVHVIPGAQVYVPGWLDVIVKEGNHGS